MMTIHTIVMAYAQYPIIQNLLTVNQA